MASPPISVDRMLGQLQATIDGMVKRDEEDRAESRDRTRKVDAILERVSELDNKIRVGIQGVDDRLRQQARDTTEQLTRVKHDQANAAHIQQGASELLKIQLQKMEKTQQDLAHDQTRMRDEVSSIKTDVAAVKVDVAAVKDDTKKLQIPVGQFESVRHTVISWTGAAVSVSVFLFFVFRPMWDNLVSHLAKLIWP
jgi:chromosome segregation ATPase